MNRLTALLDWIDEAAGALIRLAYLAAGITAVAVYFGAGHLPPAFEDPLNAALPWVLAFAVETHTYISARRVRAAWQDIQASSRASAARERAVRDLWVNLAILAGLLAFSAWNQLGYLASSGWTPGSATFSLPPIAAYVVRALVVPGAFMCAAFLAPLAEPITAQLEAEARATLADVFRIARKQRRRLLREAERSGRDMTGALVELVPDPEARRIIAHAYGAIRGELPASSLAPTLPALPALSGPPTDGGTPAEGNDPAVATADESAAENGNGTDGPPSRAAIRLVSPARNRPAKRRPSEAQLRAMAFGLLDSGEVKSQAQLRAALGVRQDRANRLYHAWRIDRAEQAQGVTQPQARAR